MRHTLLSLFAAAVALASPCAAAESAAGAGDWAWWEGEDAAATSFTRAAFAAKDYGERRDGLSGGDWLATAGKVPAGGAWATWKVTVPAAGAWHLWVRKFWRHGPFRWRFGDRPWAECGRDAGLLDTYELATHVCANWVSLGATELPAGAQEFRIELLATAGEDAPAAIDCFLLAREGIVPNGRMKPGEQDLRADDGWWAFAPPADPYGKAELDLRGLNEPSAGAKGFLRADGDGFRYGDGSPARFWAVNIGPGMVEQERAQVDRMAKRLAKAGVNMVRIHGRVWKDDETIVDPAYLDKLQYAVAALKREGIYTHLSFYFPLWFQVRAGQGLDGYDAIANKVPFGLLYFSPQMQALHRRWATGVLGTPNPHAGGVPLGKDPAVGIVELVNEDSLFFWTFSEKNIPRPQWALLERRFGAWLAARHGSLAAAFAAWPGAGQPRDDAAGGAVQLLDAWSMTGAGAAAGGAGKTARMGEQVRFLAELQRGFYASTAAWLKKDLGVQCPISAGNWCTADADRLDPVERWTCTATEVVDRHAYFNPQWTKHQRDWTVTVGDVVKPRCALLEPERLPTAAATWAGHPAIVTETAWTTINRFQADEPFVWSAYAALQGVDGVFFFALGTPGWATTAPDLGVASPACLGQAPAFALQYRRGDVREGPVVAAQALKLDDLCAYRAAAAGDVQNLDEGRKVAGAAATATTDGALDPLAPYVGRTVRAVDAPVPAAVPLTGIDRAKRTVTSATGELRWDWGLGLARVDTQRSQGATGFLAKAGSIALGDVTIACGNEYGTVQVISLDGLPLATSKRILVQAFTEQRIHGFRQDADGTIRDFGQGPINIRRIAATLAFRTPVRSATVLDGNGYARGKAALAGATVTLPEDALYTVVER